MTSATALKFPVAPGSPELAKRVDALYIDFLLSSIGNIKSLITLFHDLVLRYQSVTLAYKRAYYEALQVVEELVIETLPV